MTMSPRIETPPLQSETPFIDDSDQMEILDLRDNARFLTIETDSEFAQTPEASHYIRPPSRWGMNE
jgi:hypothetical protein